MNFAEIVLQSRWEWPLCPYSYAWITQICWECSPPGKRGSNLASLIQAVLILVKEDCMRSRKSAAAPSAFNRLGQKVLTYIDLFVRTICIILGLVVSGWVKFIDETTPSSATNHGSMSAPLASASRQLAPLPITAAQPTYSGQLPMFR
jgi:hypothetical protein